MNFHGMEYFDIIRMEQGKVIEVMEDSWAGLRTAKGQTPLSYKKNEEAYIRKPKGQKFQRRQYFFP